MKTTVTKAQAAAIAQANADRAELEVLHERLQTVTGTVNVLATTTASANAMIVDLDDLRISLKEMLTTIDRLHASYARRA